MKKNLIVGITILLCGILSFSGYAQRLTVTIPCTDTIQTLSLFNYWGESRTLLQKATRNADGKFTFETPENLPTGLYSIQAGNQKADIILSEKEKRVELSVCLNNPISTMKALRSQENAIYYDFLRINDGLWNAISGLEGAILYYPRNETFFDTLAQKYNLLQKNRLKLIEDMGVYYPESYAAKIAAIQRTPFLNAYLSKTARNKTMREDFFYGVNMDDTTLLHSDVYINKCMKYMEMYMNPNASYDELQQDIITAIDKILGACSANKTVFNFMLEYLTAGMAEYHFNTVLEHISDNWMNSDCNDTNESRLQTRIKQYQSLKETVQAPSFAVRDQEGKTLELEQIPATYTLIVFYTSTCSHCRQLLPKIAEYRRKLDKDKLEIIAVSIDENLDEWERYISVNDFEWINVREAKGWDGSVATAYGIYSTPMMFLLDQNKKIVAKLEDWSGLKKMLNKNGL